VTVCWGQVSRLRQGYGEAGCCGDKTFGDRSQNRDLSPNVTLEKRPHPLANTHKQSAAWVFFYAAT